MVKLKYIQVSLNKGHAHATPLPREVHMSANTDANTVHRATYHDGG